MNGQQELFLGPYDWKPRHLAELPFSGIWVDVFPERAVLLACADAVRQRERPFLMRVSEPAGQDTEAIAVLVATGRVSGVALARPPLLPVWLPSQTLRTLALCHTQGVDYGALFACCPAVTNLVIAAPAPLPIELAQLPHLREVTFFRTKICDALLRACANCSFVELSECGLTDDDVPAVVDALALSRWRTLNLLGNAFSRLGANCILHALAQNTRLLYLSFEGNLTFMPLDYWRLALIPGLRRLTAPPDTDYCNALLAQRRPRIERCRAAAVVVGGLWWLPRDLRRLLTAQVWATRADEDWALAKQPRLE
jgi:hypothetical protein